MKRQQGPSLLALSALSLLCTLHQTASSLLATTLSQVKSSDDMEKPLSWTQQTNNSFTNGNQSLVSRSAPKLKEPLVHVNRFSSNTSRDNTTVIAERSGRAHSLSPEEGVSPLCAYRVIEGGIAGQLCFRHTLPSYKCHEGECRTVVSFGNLVANILINGSVLLQWRLGRESTMNRQHIKTEDQKESKDPESNLTSSHSVFSGRRHRRGGYELSCWWNGSYTQFECTGVQLAHGCRDYLLTELHENIPYRVCLRSLTQSHKPNERDCVEFTLPLSGMQDIVIAMTTVGGAICVMLVIICLLVAYITENIMSPTTPHTYPYRTHSRH